MIPMQTSSSRMCAAPLGHLAVMLVFVLAAGTAAAVDGVLGLEQPLNDSGQSACYDGNSTELCDPHGYPGQDGRYGRDAAAADGVLVKTGAGVEGFDFGKIARDGSTLPPGAAPGPGPGDWACTRDHVSGLVWAIDAPTANWANATAVVAADANTAQLCGFADWRLPAAHELQGLLHYGAAVAPLIDMDYFPSTEAAQHWTSQSRISLTSQAWVVNFSSGRVEFLIKSNSRPVRLARGDAPTGGFTDNGDGTATDTRTGIVWDRCSLGQTWDGGTCVGSADTPGWQAALQAVQLRNAGNHLGHADWRLPSVKELGSLVDRNFNNPAIDTSVFPATPAALAWTSSTQTASFLNKWVADFNGGVVRDHSGAAAHVRLARGGQTFGSHDRLRYSVGGNVTGLSGGDLLLRLNGVVDLPVGADGAFVFSSLLADGAGYAVIVQEQPPGQTCTVADGDGLIAAADVDNIEVTCVAALPWTVTPIVAIGQGGIDPATPQTVDGGHRTSFTVTADAGWRIESVAGSCGGVLFGTTYLTEPVFADCTVIASFVEGTAPAQPLNDTGQNFCFDQGNALQACEPAEVPGQDGRYGRDPAADAEVLPKLGTGVEGFDFSKLAADGSELPAGAQPGGGPGDWACNRDNVSGLVWALAAPETNWNDAGTVAADANSAQLCGHTDWRLAQVQELQGLVHYGLPAGPMIDAGHFPGTMADEYWTSDVNAGNDSQAWTVDFDSGSTNTRAKTQANAVRLVRGAALTDSYLDNSDGTVTDIDTGLMWDRCDMTQNWDGSTCVGEGPGTNWLPALAEVQARNAANHLGHGDWRMANIKELETLADLGFSDPAIDTSVFPNIPPFSQLWSATTVTGTPASVQAVNLFNGSVRTLGKTALNRVRLVRAGTGYDGYDRLQRSIGGAVAGLDGDLVLQLNGGDELTISQNGPFVFPTRLIEGDNYSVVLLSHPVDQVCIVANGSGVVGSIDVTTIAVTCGAIDVNFVVTPGVLGAGAIDPDQPQLIPAGDEVTFILTPDPGWHLAGVAGSCGGVLDGATYTTSPVVADCTVEAVFAIDNHTVTASVASGNGSIVPPLQTVAHGASASFAVIAAPGHAIESVTGCGGSLAGGTYTTGPIDADCAVSASFRTPTQIVTSTGTPQTAPANGSFADLLSVTVRYADASPATNVPVQFAAPQFGPGALLTDTDDGSTGTTLTVTTDDDGIARVAASANNVAGSYNVEARVEGVVTPAVFALTNTEAADLAIVIDDGREYAHYGSTLNYVVMVANAGPSAASDIAIANAMPPGLDAEHTRWLCLGGSGVTCTADGTGPLVDSGVVVPAQGSATWLVSAPIRLDAAEAGIDNNVSLTSAADNDPGNNSASDQTVLVLLRHGFDAPYLDGIGPADPAPSLRPWAQRFVADDTVILHLPEPASDHMIEIVLEADGGNGAGFQIERLAFDSRQWLRLVATSAASAERLTPWVTVAPGAELAFGLALADDDAGADPILLLGGAVGELGLALPDARPAAGYHLRAIEGSILGHE